MSKRDISTWQVATAIGSLNAMEKFVIAARYFDDISHEQIAHELGISTEQSRQLARVALSNMRETVFGPLPDPR